MTAYRNKQAEISKRLDEDFRRYQSNKSHYYRLTSGELFAIPAKYQEFWSKRDYFAESLDPPSRVPVQDGLGFQFFLPDYSGYTFENFQDTFSAAKVHVLVTQVDPQEYEKNPGVYWEPKLTIQRRSTPAAPSIDTKNLEYKWGMTCYRSLLNHRESLECVGKRTTGQDVLWDVMDHPDMYQWFPNPQARTRYFTRDLVGGVQVTIRMHHSQIAHWREVDDFVWRSLSQWRVNAPALQQPNK